MRRAVSVSRWWALSRCPPAHCMRELRRRRLPHSCPWTRHPGSRSRGPRHSAVPRRAGVLRNVAVALGNCLAASELQPDEVAVASRVSALSDSEPLVRGHGAWHWATPTRPRPVRPRGRRWLLNPIRMCARSWRWHSLRLRGEVAARIGSCSQRDDGRRLVRPLLPGDGLDRNHDIGHSTVQKNAPLIQARLFPDNVVGSCPRGQHPRIVSPLLWTASAPRSCRFSGSRQAESRHPLPKRKPGCQDRPASRDGNQGSAPAESGYRSHTPRAQAP